MKGGAQQQPGDQISSFFWILFVFVAAVLLAWWLKRELIVTPVFFFRVYETYALQFFCEGWNHLVTWLPWLHLPVSPTHELGHIREYMVTTPTQYVQFSKFSYANKAVGGWMRYPSILILTVMAIYIYCRHSGSLFSKIYSMNTLKKQGSQNWPEITPVLSLDLLQEDLEIGPWAMAKLPLDFCKEHDMLSIGEGEEGKLVWKLKAEPAYRVFALQIGAPWRGVKALPIHLKALIVIFVARSLRERDIANRFLKQIATSAGHGKLDFSGVEEQLEKYIDAKPVSWLEKRHAYVGTLMPSLLQIARAEGVLASAEFLWLKPVDRCMWYMLNSVGRQTAVVEVAGLFAHWHAERKLARPLKNPMVKEAVKALDEEVQKILYIPDSEKWK